jgi:crotonobetainyl-CoA:carnitine CoA-transferase CaiB-like acyl-CoA transferase
MTNPLINEDIMPLKGIRVLDLSRLAPGPFCTMILGDLGADVIKIEGPPTGRLSRPALTDKEETAPYAALDRNKRSLGLNLKRNEAREIFYRLAETADVIVEGFRPGVVQRIGVDYQTIAKINPKIIYCSITGYGQSGPYKDFSGHDINYLSFGGVLEIVGIPGGGPIIPSNLIGDYAAGGMNAAIAILAAIIGREKTGKGQYLDIAMTDGVVSLMARNLSEYYSTGKEPERGNDGLTGGAPSYNVYQTRDGKYISIGCRESWFYENLCRAMDREDLIPYQNATEEKKSEVFSAFKAVFLRKTRDEWFDFLKEHDVPVGKVYELGELSTDPQLRHRDMIVEMRHPLVGEVKQVGISVKLSETPGRIRSFAPVRGQHTEEILKDLGYAISHIAKLKAEGVIL